MFAIDAQASQAVGVNLHVMLGYTLLKYTKKLIYLNLKNFSWD